MHPITDNPEDTGGQQEPNQTPLTPTAVTTEASAKTQLAELNIPAGYVLLVALHADGTEKEGTEFFYPESQYLRYYGDATRFRLKKKAS